MIETSSLISLRGAVVMLRAHAGETGQLAALELARYLALLTGVESPLTAQATETAVVLTTDAVDAASWGAAVEAESVGEQGFRLRAFQRDGQHGVVIAALTDVGLLYGVYTLLEELGMGFYAGGETFPEREEGMAAKVAATLDRTCAPAFAVRGDMLHFNFLCGCTDWGLEDYKFYFDQLARSRANLLLMHWYDGEPGGACRIDGEYITGGRAPNSLSKPWGALAALRTSEFSFGTGEFYDEEVFGCPEMQAAADTPTAIVNFEAMFSEATRYAKRLGVRVAAGFETFWSDPTDERVAHNFKERCRQFLRRNPHLTYFALWEHESGGSVGFATPEPGSSGDALWKSQADHFAYLGAPRRVWEAIRYGAFARMAYEVMQEEAPHLRLVLVGWGGDRWMQFADYCLGYDTLLPKDIIFTCHDNIDASLGPNVSTPWGQLPPDRERWAMPWVEGDLNECWSRQPNVESLGLLAPDAYHKGCQGLLTLHWRTRDVEEESGFANRFAWDPALTPEDFYRTLARHAFGPDQEQRMGEVVGTLQRLGARWTGVYGTSECGKMRWTTWEPHIPFRVDAAAARQLHGFAMQARDAFATVPDDETQNTEAGMFHMRDEDQEDTNARIDMDRPGARAFDAIATRLAELGQEFDPVLIRRELYEIEQEIFRLRPTLIHAGIPVKCHSPMDTFWIRLHHLTRHGDVRDHYAVLEPLRAELEALRDEYRTAGRIARLERLDYLLATMDFVMPFDRAAMLLAPDEEIERALAEAEAAHTAGNDARAAEVAADAYTQLVDAGMRDAVLALTRKLTTRCDFGVLCTVNVKALPLYWETIGRLEQYLPVAPPREVIARGGDVIRLEWTPASRTHRYHLYRRTPEGAWTRVNVKPLHHAMFVDQPPAGAYEYMVTALDKSGWESPCSHRAVAAAGQTPPPRITANKPAAVAEAGHPLRVHVVVTADRATTAALYYRTGVTGEWAVVPMLPTFRNAYQAQIHGDAVQKDLLSFYVTATDTAGQTTFWPESAEAGVAWTVSVV